MSVLLPDNPPLDSGKIPRLFFLGAVGVLFGIAGAFLSLSISARYDREAEAFGRAAMSFAGVFEEIQVASDAQAKLKTDIDALRQAAEALAASPEQAAVLERLTTVGQGSEQLDASFNRLNSALSRMEQAGAALPLASQTSRPGWVGTADAASSRRKMRNPANEALRATYEKTYQARDRYRFLFSLYVLFTFLIVALMVLGAVTRHKVVWEILKVAVTALLSSVVTAVGTATS